MCIIPVLRMAIELVQLEKIILKIIEVKIVGRSNGRPTGLIARALVEVSPLATWKPCQTGDEYTSSTLSPCAFIT